MGVREACPTCGAQPFTNNGHSHPGKQNPPCPACGRQVVLHAGNRGIHEEHRSLVERLRRENIALHGICRAVGVRIRWLMDVMVARFQALPAQLHVQLVASPAEVLMGGLEAEADELWSFVQQKTHRPWVWMARDQQTRSCTSSLRVIQMDQSGGSCMM
jgi:hypothetical protein